MANTTGQVMPDGSVQYYEDAMGRAMVSTDYDPTSSYAVGDYCIYDNVRYCCNTAIASGGETWNSAHWDVAKVDDDITEIKSSLSQFNRKFLWDGNQYTTGTITLDEALSDGDEIILTFKAFSASYVSQMRMLFLPNSLGYQYQFSFYGDSTQFARYRIKVKNDELNKLILEDVVNGATNCALIRIDRVVNR